MNLDVWCETDVGLKRATNQDAFLVNHELGLFVVADGMGGHSGGEVASTMAVQTMEEVIKRAHTEKSTISPKALLLNGYREASARIFARSEREQPQLKGMGTTMVTALYRNGVLYLGNVGDSRAYLHASPHFWQVTEDHSLINEQIRAGILREETAHRFVGRNVITRSVGFEKTVDCDIVERNLSVGETFLICSDGLTGLVSDSRLAEICKISSTKEIVKRCVEEAKRNGGDDNVTVMLIRVID